MPHSTAGSGPSRAARVRPGLEKRGEAAGGAGGTGQLARARGSWPSPSHRNRRRWRRAPVAGDKARVGHQCDSRSTDAAARSGEEIEVAAAGRPAVTCSHVELIVAARILRRRALLRPGRGARGQLLGLDQQLQAAVGPSNRISSPSRTMRERSAGLGFGSDVQHHGAEGGAAHARVGDSQHVLHARSSSLRGSGILPTSGMPG